MQNKKIKEKAFIMNIQEAVLSHPELREICSKLPDETVVGHDIACRYVRFSFGIFSQESISDAFIMDCGEFPTSVAEKWYRDMHQKLIDSEVRYKIKIGAK